MNREWIELCAITTITYQKLCWVCFPISVSIHLDYRFIKVCLFFSFFYCSFFSSSLLFFLFLFLLLANFVSETWDNDHKRRLYFERYARENSFDPLIPQNWYSQGREKILATTVFASLLFLSLSSFLLLFLGLMFFFREQRKLFRITATASQKL